VSKRVDYTDGSLLLGDCLEHMAGMDPGSVDLVFGSPPYEKARLYLEDGMDLGIARDTEEWVAWMVEVVKASLRVCKGLVAFVVGHGKGARRWSGSPALLCADLIRGGVCLRSPAWYKRYGIMGSGTTDWLRADLEWIVCATNTDGELPWSDNTACGHPPKYGAGGKISHRTEDGSRVNKPHSKDCKQTSRGSFRQGIQRFVSVSMPDGSIQRQGFVPPEKSNPGNVIDCGAVGGGHLGSDIAHDNEAPFPEKLASFFVRSFCPPGGVVYDPFGGSGTTLACAIKTGRRFLASDLRPSQIKLMQRRVRQARLGKGFGL
jgi:hypothetical protein